jgi:N-acetylneuraminic acid mutarotase
MNRYVGSWSGALTLLLAMTLTGCDTTELPETRSGSDRRQQSASLSVATGSMSKDRVGFSATRLSNGKVLVAGGSPNQSLASAELYDPNTGTFSATGDMPGGGRGNHVAVRLDDGQVLLTGGANSDGTQAQALRYDVSTGGWSDAGTLATARQGHSATVLSNGRVLVVGGEGTNGNILASCELFDPATGTWTSAAPMNQARQGHIAARLPDGKVLVAGGDTVKSAELYDPASNTWSYTGSPLTQRESAVSLSVANGRVLVVGGNEPFSATQFPGGVELYDPTTGTWSSAGTLSVPRIRHTAVVLSTGGVLVFGGVASGGEHLSSVEHFDPSTGTWSVTGSLLEPRSAHGMALLSNDQVLLLGGRNSTTFLASAELYTHAATCTPTTCAAQGKNCGTLSDGCGGTLTCGSCPSGQLCSAGNVCTAGTSASGSPAYDPTYRAPRCTERGSACDSDTLLVGRAGLGPETSAPNTLGSTCPDGTGGTFRYDESLDRLKVSTVDGTTLAPGRTVRIDATVWAYSVYGSDALDLFYTDNADAPSWTFLATVVPGGPGAQTLSTTYTLPSGGPYQAIRGVFRYGGTAASCGSGAYTDHDDLVFPVGDNTPSPVGPMTASADATRKAPGCASASTSCDSVGLLDGRGNVGPESNAPNTLGSTCSDGSSGTYHGDESLDRLKVSTVDGTPLAAGKTVRIEATVWAWNDGSADTLDLYSTANADSPTWTFLTSLEPGAGGQQTLSTTYTLPSGAVQAVRGVFRYQGSVGSCVAGGYNDHDDLFFAVQ